MQIDDCWSTVKCSRLLTVTFEADIIFKGSHCPMWKQKERKAFPCVFEQWKKQVLQGVSLNSWTTKWIDMK